MKFADNSRYLRRLAGALIVAAIVGVIVASVVKSGTVLSLLTQATIYAVFALGLGFLMKQNGLVSFGQAMFYGLPGYFLGIAIKHTALPPELIIIGTVLGLGVLAFLLALIIVRVPGIAFGMLTIAIGQSTYVVISKSRELTGGADGLNIDLPNRLFGGDSALFQDPASMFLISWIVLLVIVFLLALLLATHFGPLTEAIRENEERVRFVGYYTLLPRAAVFAISAMVSAVGGVLTTLYTGFVSPEALHWTVSGAALIMVVLGGSRSLWGPIVGAFVYFLMRDYLGAHTSHWMSIFGAGLIAVIVLGPEGIAGGLARVSRSLRTSIARQA